MSDTPSEAEARQILASISIPNSDDIRGSIFLPRTLSGFPKVVIDWESSAPNVVSTAADGRIAAGQVTRPPVGTLPAAVTLTANIEIGAAAISRKFLLTVRPAVKLAQFSHYGMTNFALSNCTSGQQIYMSYSIGNDATRWKAANNGQAILTSTKGMHGVRDPSIVRSPEGDKFYLVATDLNVDGVEYGWLGWNWAQSGASRYIEVWESSDLKTWSDQRHVLVAPPEAGMAFAPESIWDPEIGEYVVYWTSSMYPRDTYFTVDKNDPKGRHSLTRNETWYATTRDFVNFSPAKVMSGRPNHGTLDAVIIRDDQNGDYHRFVSDHTSTGVGVTNYVSTCPTEDIYQERAKSILAPEDDWELVSHSITHKSMNTTYAEAPLAIQANPGDVHGPGYYLFSDQIWANSPSGSPMEEQLHPYWSKDLASGNWEPISWTQKPDYDGSRGVIRHGTIFALTTAEHAVLRGARLSSVAVKAPRKTRYIVGEQLATEGLVVTATYADGTMEEIPHEGYGGYTVSGGDPIARSGGHSIRVSYAVLGLSKEASFDITVSSN